MINNKGTIVFFSGYFLPFLGGIERYTDKLTAELKKQGYKIVIVTSRHDKQLPEHEVVDDREVYRIDIMDLFRNRYPIPRINKQTRGVLKEILIKHQPKHVVCNTRFHLTTILGARWARSNGIEPVVIEHGSSHFTVGVPFLDFFGGLYEHALTLYVRKYTNRFYGVSKRCNTWLEHFGIRASGVFYNSVEHRDEGLVKDFKAPWEGSPLVVTYAGRIIREKGVQMLIESFCTPVVHRDRRIVLAIAGDGPFLEEIKSFYASNKDIYFLGKLGYEDMLSLLKATDIFCHPSMFPEGLPTAILEAGMMKCAVIATDRGGTAEVISNLENGIIIEERQDSLTEALNLLAGDSELSSRLAERLQRRIADNFVWSNTANVVINELGGSNAQ